jgi:molybdopterin-guanine dinucleotide biosynthesis protein A
VRAAGQQLPAVETSAHLRVVDDFHAESGPLAGIYTGLKTIGTTNALTVACDMPLLQPDLLAGLLLLNSDAYDAVVPTNDMFLPEPLCAVYSTKCLPAIEAQLHAGAFKVALFLDNVRVRYVRPPEWRAWDPEGRSCLNVNHHQDMRRA